MNNSNFYMKARLMGEDTPGDEIKIPIEDTVYAVCACGKEHEFSLADLYKDPYFDLNGTALHCPDCTATA